MDKLASENEVLLDYAEYAEEYNAEFKETIKNNAESRKAELVVNAKQVEDNQRLRLENDRLTHEVSSLNSMIKDLTEKNNNRYSKELLKENTKLNCEIQSLKKALEEEKIEKLKVYRVTNKVNTSTFDNTLKRSLSDLPGEFQYPFAKQTTKSPLKIQSLTSGMQTVRSEPLSYKEVKQEDSALNDYKAECERLKSELLEAQSNIKKSEESYKELEANYEALSTNFSNMKKIKINSMNAQTWDNLINENKRLSKQLENQRNSQDKLLQSLHKEVDVMAKEREVNNQKLDEAYELLKKTRAELNRAKADILLSEERTNSRNEIVEKLKAELNLKVIETTEYENKIKDLNVEQRRLTIQVEHADNQNKQILAELNIQQTKNESLNNQLQDYKKEIKKLKEKCKQVADQMLLEEKKVIDTRAKQVVANKRIINLEQENQELQNQLSKELIKLETANTELDNIKPSLININKTKSKYNELNNKTKEAFYRIEELIKFINVRYKKDFRLVLKKNLDLFGTESYNVVLPEVDLTNIENAFERLIDWFEAHKDFIETLIKGLESAVEYDCSLKAELEKVKENNKELESIVEVRSKDISLLKDKERNLVEENRDLESKLLELQREQEKLSTEYVEA